MLALLSTMPLSTAAQAPIPDEAITREFRLLANHAALIFVGQIGAIHRQAGLVEVTFRVEQNFTGNPGATCVLREWAGLWPAGQQRYQVGKRVLAFLNRPSRLGLSSPVHGTEGLVPVIVQGANAPQFVDIRRIAASVVRAPNSPLLTEANGAISLTSVLASFQNPTDTLAPHLDRQAIPLRAALPGAMQPRQSALHGSSANGNRQSFSPSGVTPSGGLLHVGR